MTRLLFILLLLLVGCNETPVSSSNEIDVDWILYRVTWLNEWNEQNESTESTDYILISTYNSPITILDPTSINNNTCTASGFSDTENPTLSFVYNNQNFNFELNLLTGSFYIFDEYSRMIYNREMEYLYCFSEDNEGSIYDMSMYSMYELIDYR